jgi:hypothetical protein
MRGGIEEPPRDAVAPSLHDSSHDDLRDHEQHQRNEDRAQACGLNVLPNVEAALLDHMDQSQDDRNHGIFCRMGQAVTQVFHVLPIR